MRTALAVTAAALALAGCGGGAAQTAASAPAQPAVIADTSTPPGSAFCARLEAAPEPGRYYAAELAYETAQAGGDASSARTIIGLWIMISCPQYAHLTKQG